MARQYWKATEEKVLILIVLSTMDRQAHTRGLMMEPKSDYLEPKFLVKAASMKQRKRRITYSDDPSLFATGPK